MHRPGAARDDDAEPAEDDASEASAVGPGPADEALDSGAVDSSDGVAPNAGSAAGAHPEAVDRSMGWRGWVLVATLAFSLLGAPALILWRPPGLPYWAALLALPMLPAILLGAVGVWATTRP